jgi:hypothetical protein
MNLASGIFVGRCDRRTSIDLIRQHKDHTDRLDLIELKQWNSNDHPFYAGYEIYRYFCALLILGKQGRDPNHPRILWPEFTRARLFVLAPHEWHTRHARHGDPNQTLSAFCSAFERLRTAREEFKCAEFHDKALQLTELSQPQFKALFRNSVEGHEVYAIENLGKQGVKHLSDWVDRAFDSID